MALNNASSLAWVGSLPGPTGLSPRYTNISLPKVLVENFLRCPVLSFAGEEGLACEERENMTTGLDGATERKEEE